MPSFPLPRPSEALPVGPHRAHSARARVAAANYRKVPMRDCVAWCVSSNPLPARGRLAAASGGRLRFTAKV